jgi:hypothetical protein
MYNAVHVCICGVTGVGHSRLLTVRLPVYCSIKHAWTCKVRTYSNDVVLLFIWTNLSKDYSNKSDRQKVQSFRNEIRSESVVVQVLYRYRYRRRTNNYTNTEYERDITIALYLAAS